MSRPAENEPPDIPGLTFVRRLGRGGYAEVFLYEQANTHMRVAVKVLFKEHLSDRTIEQFAAEANAMAELAGHPNIVQVFQAEVTSDGRPYLVMKYYPQRNLALRAKSERLSVPEVLQIGVRVTCAVETAHRAGILHRDIKPANILTSQYGEPGLTDFGIATKTSGEAEEESQGLSIPWSAPEVVFATSPGDRTADVYSLGATLWHLLGGHSPFEAPGGDNSSPALMRRIREQPVPRTERDDVPASLERLLAQTMAKNPLDRPQTALQLARSLQAIEAEERWTPTPLVLLEEDREADDNREPVWDPAADAAKEPATKRRQPHTVLAQSALPTTKHPRPEPDSEPATVRKVAVANGAISSAPKVAPASGRPERIRQRMPSIPDELATVRRPAVVTSAPSDTEADQPTSAGSTGSKVWKLAAASAMLVVVVIGTAIALSGHSAKTGSAPTTPPGPAPTLAVASLASPAVTGSRVDGTHVRFTWTVAGSQPGDRVYWKQAGGAPHDTTGDSVTVTAADAQKVCITVEVVRSTAYADSNLTCAG